MNTFVEFRKNLSEVQSEIGTNKDGKEIEIRYQYCLFDQGDGFPIKIRQRIFDGQEPYKVPAKYVFPPVADFIEIKKFDGQMTLAIRNFLPRLQLVDESTGEIIKTSRSSVKPVTKSEE